MSSGLRSLYRSALHLLLPRLCAGCGTPLLDAEPLLCLACGLELPLTGFRAGEENEAALRLAGRFPFRLATALLHFTEGGLPQHLIHLLKYKRRAGIGVALGRMLGEEGGLKGHASGIDLILPVPLHPGKEASRGFNQSALIAEGLGEVLGIPVLPHGLRRVRATESQTSKTRAERVENVAGAFAVRDAGRLAGRHVLLVDDVLTTGATLEACAGVVLDLRGARVSVATLAIAGR